MGTGGLFHVVSIVHCGVAFHASRESCLCLIVAGFRRYGFEDGVSNELGALRNGHDGVPHAETQVCA